MSSPEVVGAVIGALGAIGTVAVTFTTLKNSFKKELQKEIKDSVDAAREIAEADIRAFNLRIDSISKEIQSLDLKVDKDIHHVKEIYNSEIKQLANKIESLREDVQRQHQQLVDLLTKLITDK